MAQKQGPTGIKEGKGLTSILHKCQRNDLMWYSTVKMYNETTVPGQANILLQHFHFRTVL